MVGNFNTLFWPEGTPCYQCAHGTVQTRSVSGLRFHFLTPLVGVLLLTHTHAHTHTHAPKVLACTHTPTHEKKEPMWNNVATFMRGKASKMKKKKRLLLERYLQMRTNDVTPELIHISTQEQTNKAIKDPYNQCEYVPGIWNYKQRKQKKKKKSTQEVCKCFFVILFFYLYFFSFFLSPNDWNVSSTYSCPDSIMPLHKPINERGETHCQHIDTGDNEKNPRRVA